MDTNMDIDMDLDLGLDDAANAEAEAEAMNIQAEVVPSSPSEAGEIDEEAEAVRLQQLQGADIAAEKIHVRGLDNLTTDDIYAFAAEHNPAQRPAKVEWVDDTSANIVYPSTSTAGTALRAFTLPSIPYPDDPLDLRPAKGLSTNPSTSLTIRLALLTDKKAPRAGDASRFYLMNPDKDPREQRRRNGNDRRPDNRNKRRRDSEEEEPTMKWDASMYDDPPAASLAARITRPLTEPRRHRDRSASLDRSTKRTRRTSEDLFANRRPIRTESTARKEKDTYGRLRDRSASPLRDSGAVDGRHGFAEPSASHVLPSDTRRTRRRSFTPPSARPKVEKDLFANRLPTGSLSVLGSANTTATAGATKELFPSRMSNGGSPSKDTDLLMSGTRARPRMSGHQRTSAIDGGTKGDLFSRIGNGAAAGGGSLADRITHGPGSASSPSGMKTAERGGGFTIRGSGTQAVVENPGFSIKGLGAEHKRVKELFPDRLAGGGGGGGGGGHSSRDRGGKDLFEDRLAGRGGGGGGLEGRITGGSGRRRAEDLFL